MAADFRVIIVGAGIGGLTLASCLQHAGIDYLMLEGRDKIGFHVGAGIGLEANGDRILDQLGIRKTMEDDIKLYQEYIFRDREGKILHSNDEPQLIHARCMCFSHNFWG